MPKYSYTATSLKGERISGKEIAKNERALASLLHAKGYVLTSADIEGKKKKSFELDDIFGNLFGVSLTAKLMFMRNFQVMMASGIALPKALDVLQKQAKQKKFQKALQDMREKVMQGESLSKAMEMYPDIFPELFSNMIKAGEESGTMEGVLAHLALQLEHEHDLKSKIQGALMYPAVILVAMIGIGILMLILVVPTLAATFEELKVDLPMSTQFIIGFAEFIKNFWYLAALIAMVGSFVFWRAIKSTAGKNVLDTVVLRLPIFGNIVRKINSAFFARTLSSLLGAGIPMVRSLRITARVLGNNHFKAALFVAAEKMEKGIKLSDVLAEYTHLYPLIVVQMIEVGEETGHTGDMLAKLAEFFEEEVESITNNLSSIIEPMLMIIIGAVVGFFAVSMIQPMYSMLGSV